MKLPRPKEIKKIFYSPRMDDKDLEALLEFGISYSLNTRIREISDVDQDKFFNQALKLMRKKNYCSGKIFYIIRRKMNRFKFGFESSRICRTVKKGGKR